jgi:hypothetical protein
VTLCRGGLGAEIGGDFNLAVGERRVFTSAALAATVEVWHDDPSALNGGLRTGCRVAGIPESIDILLRKEETSAMITGDEKLDRREFRDHAKDRRIACSRPASTTRTGSQGRGEKFLFESVGTH